MTWVLSVVSIGLFVLWVRAEWRAAERDIRIIRLEAELDDYYTTHESQPEP